MRALIKNGGTVGVKDVPKPDLQSEKDVLIRVMLAGLCRTDVFAAEGRVPCKDTVILGHEFSGIIERAGAEVADFRQGDKVAVMPVMPCRHCSICLSGRETDCQSTTMLGIDLDGAFAEYVAVPAAAVYHIPANMSFRQAAYAEPVAASLSVMKAGIEPRQRGLIYGDNRFSHLISRILLAYGFENVTIFDPARAPALNANSFDFAIETMATAQVMDDIFRALKPGGRAVLKSRKHEPVGINFSTAVRKEITLSAVNYGDFNEALRLMGSGRLQVDDLFGEVHDLEDFEAVFARAKTHESKKVFFKPGAADVRDC